MKGPSVTQSDSAAASESSSSRSAISHAGSSRTQVDLERSARSFGGGSVQLADLEEVDVRTVFQRDGDGFSGWLAGNLDRLSKELGVSGLREVGRDIAVGSFTVDILAQTDKGRRVAITNQLETTDHIHLGQVVTFAAGLEVSAVIWLNQHGDDEVRFFAVELRLLRIGNSLPAAVFNVATKPNDWQKVARQRQRVSSPFNSRMREF